MSIVLVIITKKATEEINFVAFFRGFQRSRKLHKQRDVDSRRDFLCNKSVVKNC